MSSILDWREGGGKKEETVNLKIEQQKLSSGNKNLKKKLNKALDTCEIILIYLIFLSLEFPKEENELHKAYLNKQQLKAFQIW